jgi:signal transduction histidine kinase
MMLGARFYVDFSRVPRLSRTFSAALLDEELSKRETLACLSNRRRMSPKPSPVLRSPVLVFEPDSALRALLVASLHELNFTVIAANEEEFPERLAEESCYAGVLYSSALRSRLDLKDLRQDRPQEERWVMMSPPEGTEEMPEEKVEVLVQPFRTRDLEAAMQGGESHPEDAVLSFMRQREREFGRFRRKESHLREAHRHFKELERMKSTFLSLVSHELRTPLTVISGNLHVLRKLSLKWDNQIATDCLGSAHEGTKRLSKLVDELLRFTVSAPQKRDRWDLALTLRRLCGELAPVAQERGLQLSLETVSLPIEGDPAGLPDALLQLVENALLFNNPGGTVEVTGRRSDDGDWVEVQVMDNGPGIDQSEIEKVFHPFYQIADVNTRSVEGLGIGLSLARRTIESHGGRLNLQSTLGTGTCAIITLPIHSQKRIPLPSEGPILPPAANANAKDLREYAQEIYELWEAEQIKRRHAEEQKLVLEQTFIETLVSLIRMVDPRVSGGTSQGERVLDYARAVARHLDPTLLSRPEFLYGLLLYDIGKIGVTEAVLSKTGGLTDKERRAAQAHSEIGADLLTSVGVLQPAIDAVRSHHERWDGSGYPDGLKGQQIPILARIIAVVDSFDAMTVNRPWREALSLDAARAQVEQGAGTAFDPSVVEAFGRGWGEISEVFTRANTSSKLKSRLGSAMDAPLSTEGPLRAFQ